MAVSHRKKKVIFVVKKVVTLTNIHQMINNGKKKNFGNKIKNFAKIKANTMHFWLIINEI